MIGPRRLLACVVVAANLGVPALALASSPASPHWAPPASRANPHYERFIAWVSGSQITTWKQPTRSQGDCSYHYTTTPQGREVVKFHTGHIKLLAVDFGLMVMFKYYSWNPDTFGPLYWPAGGTTQRQDLTTTSWTAGPCDPSAKAPVRPKEDCNPTRLRHWDLRLGYYASDQTLGFEFIPLRMPWLGISASRFVNCPIATTGQAQADTISDVRVDFPAKDLFGGYGKQIAIARKTWRTRPPGPQITTTVRWTLTLVRQP